MDSSIYIHVPFCRRRCGYCDFAISTRKPFPIEAYVQALGQEISARGTQHDGSLVASLAFGGGTPSLLGPQRVAEIVDAIAKAFPLASDAELSMELNPDGVDANTLAAFGKAGINRLSVGVQSLDPSVLKVLGRLHDGEQALAVLDAASRTFDKLSADVLLGAPRQDLASLEHSLERLLPRVGHLSLYALTLEAGTPFAVQVQRGLKLPHEDQVLEHWRLGASLLNQAGFERYEVSNWARPKHQSTHNSMGWMGHPYTALGPSAHGFLPDGSRYANAALKQWLKEPCSPPQLEHPTLVQRRIDWLLGRWRLKKGLSPKECQLHLGVESLPHLVGPHWETWVSRGWVTETAPWAWTEEGVLLHDSLLEAMVSAMGS